MQKKIAVFPGTFDPVTKGHLDLLQRAVNIFDKVVIAVADNPKKKPLFSVKERVDLVVSSMYEEFSTNLNIRHKLDQQEIIVVGFSNLLVEFLQQQKAQIILRGLRVVSDFEYEFQLANMNRRLASDIETMFLTPAEQYSFVSSSLVKEVSRLNGDVSGFVGNCVVEALDKKYCRESNVTKNN